MNSTTNLPGEADLLLNNTNQSTTNVIYDDVFIKNAIFNGEDFEDQDSYQSKAATWVQGTTALGLYPSERILQRYALACFYFATNGVRTKWTDEVYGFGGVPPWIDDTGWLDYENECDWYGISCNHDGRVIGISLTTNRVTGSVPSELSLLAQSLLKIDLFNNHIYNSGSEGNHWLGQLSNLQKLYFGKVISSTMAFHLR